MFRFALATGIVLMTTLNAQAQNGKVVLVIHGGAGVDDRKDMPPERERQYRADLEKSLKAGFAALQKPGATSLDGVEAAIRVLEDSPLFNAGKGAVFNMEGRNELNASIMEGRTRKAGAVAGVCRIKNPISAARAVMEKSDHVFLIGEGAERFAKSKGLEEATPLYFWTDDAWKRMLKAKEAASKKTKTAGAPTEPTHFGTVGAVALDSAGNIAAGTSTGGITYRLPGRVGDSPIIGAGTYADNDACGVSCTGVGELFIRHAVSFDIVARLKYKREGLGTAVGAALDGLPKRDGGVGGIIALDRQGRVEMRTNTSGMFRGIVTSDGRIWTGVYADEKAP